jgi:dTDP-4-dehydrorhamnose 3,5-epimerase
VTLTQRHPAGQAAANVPPVALPLVNRFGLRWAIRNPEATFRKLDVQILNTEIADVKLIKPVRHGDARGFFSEIYREDAMHKYGIELHFVQENHSLSAARGVLRGLHFQTPPAAQAKLVRVAAGSILDVAVDIRRGSPSYGKHVAVVLNAADGFQLLVPEGFAHGFCTLEPNTEVVYKVSAYYSPENDKGMLWNDPALGIKWSCSEAEATLSEKDRHHPTLAELPPYFTYSLPL